MAIVTYVIGNLISKEKNMKIWEKNCALNNGLKPRSFIQAV